MSEKPTTERSNSPWRMAWRRFRRNRLALLGLVWLVICVAVSIFAYPLMPDKTRNANFRVVELAKSPPGTEAELLLKPLHTEVDTPGWLGQWMAGSPDRYSPILLQGGGAVRVSSDSIYFLREGGYEESELLPVFMLDVDASAPEALAWKAKYDRPYEIIDQQIRYINHRGEWGLAFLGDLQAQLRAELIVRKKYLLGTDSAGRDVLSRLILGARVSMSVGLMAVLVSLVLGIFLGAMSGFFRGWVDTVVMWFVQVIWSLPVLLLAISLSFAFGEGFWQLFLAIGAATWVEVARIVRGQIFTLREMQYVEATRAMGFRSFRVITRHILPNILSPLIIVAAANFASAILIEAGLSFLGVGVKAPVPSWGSMIQEGYTQIFFDSGSWLAFFPGLAIILVVISLNLVGFGLRDALDPKYEAR